MKSLRLQPPPGEEDRQSNHSGSGELFFVFFLFSTDDEWNNSFQSRRGSDKSRTNDSG